MTPLSARLTWNLGCSVRSAASPCFGSTRAVVTSACAMKRSQTTSSMGSACPANLVPLSSRANMAQATTVRPMPASAARAGDMEAGAVPRGEDGIRASPLSAKIRQDGVHACAPRTARRRIVEAIACGGCDVREGSCGAGAFLAAAGGRGLTVGGARDAPVATCKLLLLSLPILCCGPYGL